MTVQLIGILTLLIGIASLFRPAPFTVNVFFCSTLLGASAALVLDSLGGTNISPSHLLLGFLLFRLLSDERVANNALQGVSFGRPGFWLLLTVIFSIISAFFMPRLFAGQTLTFPVRAESNQSVPLAPAMSNITQSIYFIGNFACFITLYGYASTLSGRKVLGGAAIACATLNLIFGALDLLTYFTNTTELFSFIRNANYALLSDTEVAGFKRIVGSFTEASSFGSATLGYFAFTGRLWLLGIRTQLTAPLAFLSLMAMLFATSTTAYVGLGAFLALSYLQVMFSALRRPITMQMSLFLIVGPIVMALGTVAIALNDNASAYAQNLVDTMVLNKLSTASGIERSSWNEQALQNFFDTFGFGVGNGSVRASSFPIGVLASLGIVGALIFSLFFITFLLSRGKGDRSDALDDGYRQAAKAVCIAWLITATISGALIDLGLAFYTFAALTCAEPRAFSSRNYKQVREMQLARSSG